MAKFPFRAIGPTPPEKTSGTHVYPMFMKCYLMYVCAHNSSHAFQKVVLQLVGFWGPKLGVGIGPWMVGIGPRKVIGAPLPLGVETLHYIY